MEGQHAATEDELDELAGVVSKEPGTNVTREIEGGTVSAEALGGAGIRLRFYGVSRDAAATIAVDLLGSSGLTEEPDGSLSAEHPSRSTG
jgi:hypothetical protein